MGTNTRVCTLSCILLSLGGADIPRRLGPTVVVAFTVAFQGHVFSILPSSFAQGFKSLVAITLNSEYDTKPPIWMDKLFPPEPVLYRWDRPLWVAFEMLGLNERYESLISSVCFEHIEAHIKENCSKVWDQPSLADVREWMSDSVVPWLIAPYSRGAKTREHANVVLRF